MVSANKAVMFRYLSHRHEAGTRTATPVSIYFGSTEWHPRPQWLMVAWDHDKEAVREFALVDCDFLTITEGQRDLNEIDGGDDDA